MQKVEPNENSGYGYETNKCSYLGVGPARGLKEGYGVEYLQLRGVGVQVKPDLSTVSIGDHSYPGTGTCIN